MTCHHNIPNTFIVCGEGGNFCSTECATRASAAYACQTLVLFLVIIVGVAALKGCP